MTILLKQRAEEKVDMKVSLKGHVQHMEEIVKIAMRSES